MKTKKIAFSLELSVFSAQLRTIQIPTGQMRQLYAYVANKHTLDTLRQEKDRNRETRECFFAKRLVSPDMQTDCYVCLSVITNVPKLELLNMFTLLSKFHR